MKRFLALFFIIFWVNPARAAYVTGEMLSNYCGSETPTDMVSCANYIAGIIDYHVFMQSMGAVPELGFCLPENITIEEVSFKVMKYLKSAPQQYEFIAAPSVIMALNKEYPCAR